MSCHNFYGLVFFIGVLVAFFSYFDSSETPIFRYSGPRLLNRNAGPSLPRCAEREHAGSSRGLLVRPQLLLAGGVDKSPVQHDNVLCSSCDVTRWRPHFFFCHVLKKRMSEVVDFVLLYFFAAGKVGRFFFFVFLFCLLVGAASYRTRLEEGGEVELHCIFHVLLKYSYKYSYFVFYSEKWILSSSVA